MTTETEIITLFRQLSNKKQREMLSELTAIASEKNHKERPAPAKCELEEAWEEVGDLLLDLSCEPYIDDQIEIDEIYEIIEDIIAREITKEAPWKVRKKILTEIADHEYYDEYGVSDPMQDLLRALLQNEEEKTEIAGFMWDLSKYMRADAALLYKEAGHENRYYEYKEQALATKAEDYLELARYYVEKDRERAIAIAEKGRSKCTSGLTGLYAFLMRCAAEDKDQKQYDRLLQSAKRRSGVSLSELTEELADILPENYLSVSLS